MSVTGPGTGGPSGDPDRLLDGYRAARAQDVLFDVRGRRPLSGGTGYDEFVDEAGQVRPEWRDLGELIAERGRDGLDRLRDVLRGLVDNDGITYIDIERHGASIDIERHGASIDIERHGASIDIERHGANGSDGPGIAMPGPWQLDGIPLIVSAPDWQMLEAAVLQRSRLLDVVLDDLYGERRALTSGILPPQLLFGHPGYIRAAQGTRNPGRHQLFMLGCDVSRGAHGRFTVNADWTQAPSGAGYALADRRVVARAVPDIYERFRPRPVTPFAQALRLALIDAAPDAAEDPVVVVLSPGIHSQTAFDQAYLAMVLGFPLVESADLLMRDGALWMRSLGNLKRVDVVLRRVDADYADPLDLRPDSRLGVVGLIEAQRRGTVSVVNTLGSGILESPGVQRFLPELAELLLGEKPLLDTPRYYWAGNDSERSHIIARLPSLLVKSVVGPEVIVGPILTAAQRAEIAARIEAQPWQWVGQELPQFSSAPTVRSGGALVSANVGLRLFTVSQRGGYAPMVGGLGYALSAGPGAYTLDKVAAKDIWVRPTARAGTERAAPASSVKLPSGAQFVSSPRVLADLFWIGRYAERTEDLARLLIVTRERYHEFRNRPDAEARACLPVLLSALYKVADVEPAPVLADEERIIDAPRALWSLSADRALAGSLAHSVDGLGLAARAVRDQMSNDTWMVLSDVERALFEQAQRPPEQRPGRRRGDDTVLAVAQRRALSGMLALSGMAAESMVRDAGWTMMDIGRRIERGLALTALLRSTLTVRRAAGAEQAITDSVLIACESSVIYRRRNLGQASVAAVAELLLFDDQNPRSVVYQLHRLRDNLRALPGTSGSSRPERMIEEIVARLRRLDPTELEHVGPDGQRTELDRLLGAIYAALRDVSDVITQTQLSLPGDMQPLWGPDQRRVLP
ncbi:circularly permuted type 2 ATP-grasp protein [Mycolicibacterium sp.]|uniref:circularly permuted type 2 ATP-grasp protein n=1 Tax=Mycolicibacterium sp. TaxID=2320850 RepID=UPI0037C8408C